MIMFCLTADISAESKLKTEAEVSAYVDSITSFDNIKDITRSFKRVDVTDDNTPFLYKQINGKKDIWVQEIKNVRLKLKSTAPAFKDKYNRTFKIFIDPNGGMLLKIMSKFEGYDPNLLPEPNAISAQKQLFNSTGELYLGFPKEPPKISFLDALNVCIGSPMTAKEIDAIYVLWKSNVSPEPRKVWIITLRGISMPSSGGPPWIRSKDNNIITRMRTVVDADTGKAIIASTIPIPEVPDKTKK